MKLLHVKSTLQIIVIGVLADEFEIQRGVKQECPLFTALYVLAINPLLKKKIVIRVCLAPEPEPGSKLSPWFMLMMSQS